MPDRFLLDATPGSSPEHGDVQQLIEAESGKGEQGIARRWQASDSTRVVLTSDAAGVKISRDNGATPPAQVIVDGTPAGGHLGGTYPNPALTAGIQDLICPPGTIVAYGGVAAPAGWLPCDGAAYATAAYPRLQAVLGYAYGGNGTTVFAVPDLRGRFPLGASGPHPRASVGGSDSPAHTHPQTHSHGMNNHTHGPGLHTHGPGQHTHAGDAHTHPGDAHTHPPGIHTHGMTAHTHVVDVDHDHPNALAAAGASATATNAILNGTGASTTVPASNHTHPVDIPSLTTTLKTSQGAAPTGTASGPSADNTAGATAASTGAATAASTGTPTSTDATTTPLAATPTDAATGSTTNDSTAGGGTWATDGLPPFQVVAYIIRTGN